MIPVAEAKGAVPEGMLPDENGADWGWDVKEAEGTKGKGKKGNSPRKPKKEQPKSIVGMKKHTF